MNEHATPRPSGAAEWLRDSAMSVLVDYYTEVPFRPYGSGATRENVLPFLKELRPGYLCVYAKGHSGATAYPSALRTEHAMLAGDLLRFYRDVTREAGVRLVPYYSGLLDGIAGERHPEWRQWNREGKPCDPSFGDFGFFTSYALCPQSGYWDDWASVQIREIVTTYEPDGIWIDGDWPGPCYCPRCQARLRADTGWGEPWDDVLRRPDFAAAYARSWNRITHEWRVRFSGFVKSLAPACLYSAGNVSPRREFLAPFDWRSGDLFSPGFFALHDMARMMRWYGTLGVLYDAYVCDTGFTHARKHVRSRSKTLERMLQEAATVAANGGAVGYWTYPLGNGALVPSRMRKAIEVRRFLAEREELFLRSESAAWTAIVAGDPSAPTFGDAGIEGAHKALAALHRSPDVIDESCLAGEVPYDLLVLPEQTHVLREAARHIEAFVRRGGALLTSGSSLRSPEIQEILDVGEVRFGEVADGHVILRTHSEPTGIDGPWDRVEAPAAEELYPLYLSWDQLNPEARLLTNNWPMHGQLDEEHPERAGFPAAITRRLGKGRIVHVCTGVFSRYRTLGDPQILRWLREIVEELDPAPAAATDAPSWVDLSLRQKGGRLLAHFVNQNPGRDVAALGTNDLWVDEIPEVGPFGLELRTGSRPRRVWWEPEHRRLPVSYRGGVARIGVPRFRIHGCVVVEPTP
jgi:hypothetical protein